MREVLLYLHIGLAIVVAVSVLTGSLSYGAFGSRDEQSPWQRVVIQIVLVVTAISIVVLSIGAQTGAKGIWVVMGICSLVLLVCVCAGFAFEVTVPTFAILLIASIVLGTLVIVHLSDDNPYNITEGEVINQYLESDGSSALELEYCESGECYSGWVYFDDNVIFDYPVGSYYNEDSGNLG